MLSVLDFFADSILQNAVSLYVRAGWNMCGT